MKTYGTLRFTKSFNAWLFEEVPPHVSIRIKDCLKGMGNQVRPPYLVKATMDNIADIHWFIKRYPMKMTDEDRALLDAGAENYLAFHSGAEELFMPDYVPGNLEMKEGKQLYPYQGQFRDIWWKVRDMLLADEVGLGKTPQAIAGLMNKEFLPGVVVVQSHLTKQWKDQIQAWSNLRVCVVPDGKQKALPLADIYIVKYTTLAKWIDYLAFAKPKTLVLDEIQEIRHEETKKHEAAKKMWEATANHLGMSGSPIYNYGIETWNIFQAIKPQLFPSKQEFRSAWCEWDKVKDTAALNSYLLESKAYLRRTKADIGSQIPPVNKIIHTVDYDEKEMLLMEYRAKTLARTLLDSKNFIEKGQAARELSIMVRKATGVSKARSVADYVRILLESGQPVVLAGWHREVYDIWLKELGDFKPVMYTGTESPKQKDESLRKFVEGESNLFIISLRSGVGLDGLQKRCSFLVVGELDWSPAVHEQLVGRLYRDGQLGQVTAIFLVSDSGSDPIVMDILGIKKAQSTGIFDPLAMGTKQVSDDSIIQAFAKKFLERA